MTEFLIGKISDELYNRLIGFAKDKKAEKKLKNEIEKLKKQLDEKVIKVEYIQNSGEFYNYIKNNNIIEKIFDNWLNSDVDNNIEDCIEQIINDDIPLNPTDKLAMKDVIKNLYEEVDDFFKNSISQEDRIMINQIIKSIKSEISKNTENITENIIENNNKNADEIKQEILKLAKKGFASLKELSDITKDRFANRFFNKGLFEQKSNKNSITIDKMYIQPKAKIYNNNNFDVSSEDIEIDALIKAFVEHKDKDEFLNQLNIQSTDNEIIDNIFECFEPAEGSYYDEIDKNPYKKILFIYGDAGTGKSTFIYKKCHTNRNDKMNVLSMKDITIDKDQDTLKYKFDNDEEIKIDFDNVEQDSVLYLDGFDESSDAENIVRQIYDKTRKYNLKIIVTSRIDYKIGSSLEKHTMYSKINFLTNEEILEYIKRYFTHYEIENTDNYNNYVEHIKTEIERENDSKSNYEKVTDKNSEEFNMYKIPIILYLFSNDVAYESLKNNSQPYNFESANKYGVYKRLFGEGSRIYSGKNKRTAEEKVRDTLKNIAFEMFRQRKLNIKIDKKSLKKDFNMEFCIKEVNRVGAGEFYMNVNGIDKKPTCEFYHKSFYDYFVAEKMADVIVGLIKDYDTDKIEGAEREKLENLLNVYFGLNYITKDIYYFLDEVINDKYAEKNNKGIEKDKTLNKIRNNFFENQIDIENEFIKFFREFVGCMCVPSKFDEKYMKYGIERNALGKIMSNTFSNVTTVLLCILRQAESYSETGLYSGINIFGIYEKNYDQFTTIRNLMFLKYDNDAQKFFSDICLAETETPRINSVGDGMDLSGIIMNNHNLSYTNLSYVKLSNAMLNNTDLRNTSLDMVNFRYVKLSCADLRGANLSDADLRGADLRGANLIGANLQFSDLKYADLRGANITGITLEKEQIRGVTILDTDIVKFEFTREELLEYGVEIIEEGTK